MINKLLYVTFAMLFGMAVSADAQIVRKASKEQRISMRTAAKKNVMTSNLDLKGNELWTGYWDGSIDNLDQVGAVDIPMDYGVAIKIEAGDKMTENRTVEGIRFTFADHKDVEDVYVWISTTLPDTPEQADICYQKVTDVTSFADYYDYFNDVRFDKPYKVDPTKDFYVGYSFSINSGSNDDAKYPVVFWDHEDVNNSLLMLCGEDGWEDYSNDDFGPAAIQILVSGEFESNAAEFSFNQDMMAPRGLDFAMPLTVKNMGTDGIENMDLKLELSNGEVYNYSIKPFDKVEGMYTEYEFQINVPAPDVVEEFGYTATIEKVNGNVNAAGNNKVEGNIQVLTRLGERKVLFEEFTGMWCGWCPRGIIAMEKIGEKYGDKVARVAVHHNDAIKCNDYKQIIQQTVAGFPNAHINRTFMGVDPYFGREMDRQFAVKDLIDKCFEGAPEAEINVNSIIEGDVINVTADITFLYTGDADNYALAYILTEDGMENEKWIQSNNYAKYEGEDVEPAFQEWVNANYRRAGVVYNEVAIAAKGIDNGIDGSIPSSVNEEEVNKHSVEFNISDYEYIQDTEKMNVVCVLFDRNTGKVVNADIKPLNNIPTGIVSADGNDGNVVETARYNAEGRLLNNPEKGLNIIKYSDGTYRKVIIR